MFTNTFLTFQKYQDIYDGRLGELLLHMRKWLRIKKIYKRDQRKIKENVCVQQNTNSYFNNINSSLQSHCNLFQLAFSQKDFFLK